jgi:hypothetical protein
MPAGRGRGWANAGLGARIANLILGAWLFISAFIWPHSPAQMTNTWIMGLIIAVLALISMAASQARYLNTAASIWLFISVWVLPGGNAGTQWNNAVVAILVFLFSLAPGPSRPLGEATTPGPRRTPPAPPRERGAEV